MSSISDKISEAASSVKDAVSNAATYVHDAVMTTGKPARTYTNSIAHVNSVQKAGDDAEDKVQHASKLAVAAIDGAAGIAHAAIKVSSGDSGVSGAKDIFKESSKDAVKKFECQVKEAKEELSRATSSAKDTCTADEKTAVTEAIKVAEAKLDGAVKIAKAEVDQAHNKCEDSVKCSGATSQVSEKAADAATLGYKTAQIKFEQSATDALNIVKSATKNVRDAKTPGEATDARLIVKNELVRATQALEQANLDATRNREDVTSLGCKGAAEINCATTKAKIEAADKEALAKQKATYADFKAKLEAEAKTVAA